MGCESLHWRAVRGVGYRFGGKAGDGRGVEPTGVGVSMWVEPEFCFPRAGRGEGARKGAFEYAGKREIRMFLDSSLSPFAALS